MGQLLGPPMVPTKCPPAATCPGQAIRRRVFVSLLDISIPATSAGKRPLSVLPVLPVRLLAAGVTGDQHARQTAARAGRPAAAAGGMGTGMTPADAIADTVMGRGAPGALDNVIVRWGGGGDVQAGE